MFVFVATQAIAIVEIEVSGQHTEDDPATTPDNEEQIAITLTYNVVPDPVPTETDFTFGTGETPNFGDGGDNDPRTYVISNAGSTVTFTLTGYVEVVATGASGAVTFTNATNNKLEYAPGYLPGQGYGIVARNTEDIADGVFPTLPTIAAPNAIIKFEWADMPDLYELFTGGGTGGLIVSGGTLNLRVNEPGTTNRLGSKMADDTYDDDHNRNQQQVVINEIMWAYDEVHVGKAEYIQEQWIELYNQKTTPIAWTDIVFITSKDFPAPEPETDMLSNVPGFRTTWKITDKGQHGRSQTPKREFKSMQRVNLNNGWEAGHWSIAPDLFINNYRGTPGKQNRGAAGPTTERLPAQDNPAINKIIINEIANLSDDTLDWIELRNVTATAQSLNGWALTITTGVDNEDVIIEFKTDISIPARSVLLLVNKNPLNTPLSMGFDVGRDAADQGRGAGPHQFLTVDENRLAIPDGDAWLLILRSNKPWDVRNEEEIEDDATVRHVYQSGHRVEDVAGPGALDDAFTLLDIEAPSLPREKKPDGHPGGEIWLTKAFPLNGNLQADTDFLQEGLLDSEGKVWVRDGAKQGHLKGAWSQAAFVGVGYDRSARKNDQNSGTPGYDNNVVKGRLSQLDGGRLIISELMLSTGTKRNLPQWIELYNTSKTQGIDLAADRSAKPEEQTGWQLIIENHDSGSWKEFKRNLNITINLKELFRYIPPHQTVLIAAAAGRNADRNYFSDARVADIFGKEETKAAFSMANKKDAILNAEGGFYLKIVDGDGAISDEIGNLDGQEPNLRQGIGLDDPFSWNWSTDLTEDGDRTSLLRLRDTNGRPRLGVPNRNIEGDLTGAVLPIGKKGRQAKYAWIHAVDTKFKTILREELWYGDSSDFGTPGFIQGTPLPVNLSFFRPTLENGAVVIRWTTESEMDNAGFNIYRSQTRYGEFKQVNTQLIQGAGTTGERQTYKWIDTTAKQGVIYYYQIEDVSFAGERQVLTTTRLKGYVSASNKLTTTWSELKSAQ